MEDRDRTEDIRDLVEAACGAGTCLVDLAQRVGIIAIDVVLWAFAAVALYEDWDSACDQAMQLYGMLCTVLIGLDLIWEVCRCTSEANLDRVQEDFRLNSLDAASCGNEGASESLLDDVEDEEARGPPTPARPPPDAHGALQTDDGSAHEAGPHGRAAAGRGVLLERAMARRRVGDLQVWSIVFSCFVSVMFAFFSAHDEDCKERVPYLYRYVHGFTYVFAFRLGIVLILVCCRAVKNYEDAAGAAAFARGGGGRVPTPPPRRRSEPVAFELLREPGDCAGGEGGMLGCPTGDILD